MTFQPSSTLQRLLNTEQPQPAPVPQFKLSSTYERKRQERPRSEEPHQELGGTLDSLFSGRGELRLIEFGARQHVPKADVFQKYQKFMEPQKLQIQDHVQQEIEIQEEVEAPVASDPEELERLMKPNAFKPLPRMQQEIDLLAALRSGQTVLLQLPSSLPFEQAIQTSKQMCKHQVQNLDDKEDLMKEFYLNDLYDSAGFLIKSNYQQVVNRDSLKRKKECPCVSLGKMVFDRSGRVQWELGEESYTIEAAIQTTKPRELVAVDLEQQTLIDLGEMGPKFIATPDVESLIS